MSDAWWLVIWLFSLSVCVCVVWLSDSEWFFLFPRSLPEMRDSRLQINASLRYKPNKKLREAKYLCQSQFTMQCYDSSARGGACGKSHVRTTQLWYVSTFKLIWHQQTCVQDANHSQIFRAVMLILTLDAVSCHIYDTWRLNRCGGGSVPECAAAAAELHCLLGWRPHRSLWLPELWPRMSTFKFSGIGSAHGRVSESMTYKADGMRDEVNISHSCESPVATSAARPPCISHSRRSQGRCAACFLTWLCDSSSAQYFTQTHSPVMIYCLAAYSTTLGPDSCKCATVGGSL